MEASPRRFLPLILKGLVSVGLIVYLFRKQLPNLESIRSALLSADPYLVLLAASLHILGFLICSYRWRLLLLAQGADFSMGELVLSYLVGMFFNSFLPGTMSGDVVRAMDTAGRAGSMGRSMLVVFVERLTGMIALLVMTGAVLTVFGPGVLGHPNITFFLVFLTFFILVSLGLLFHPAGYDLMERMVDGIPAATVQRKFRKIAESLHAFSGKGRVLGLCVLISLLFQANVVLHFWILGEALEIDISWTLYFAIIPVSLLLLMLPASINGIGLREQVFILLFGNFGVSAVVAVSLAWIAFGISLLQAFLGGVAFGIRKKNR
ncbi:MAG: YbhN family protein [Desulfococcaceae bacterium]